MLYAATPGQSAQETLSGSLLRSLLGLLSMRIAEVAENIEDSILRRNTTMFRHHHSESAAQVSTLT